MSTPKILIEKELGAIPSVAEMEVVDILVLNKIPKVCVKFLKPSRVEGMKTPDILIDEVPWEIKCIEKTGKYTLEHALRTGLKQANNLVVDLRKQGRISEDKTIIRLKSQFDRTRSWRGLIVVVRFNGECLIFKK